MLLEIKKLSVRVKSSGLKAVDGIDLSVDAGEPLLILGQSGSGKTMICRAEDCKAVWSSYPYMLSGGMLQRAAVAAAIMNRPRLIIADEPTTALDAEHRIAVTDMLKSLCGSAAVIMVTHDFAVAGRFGGHAYIMKNGVFVEQGDIKKMISSPENEYTKELLDAALLI